MNQTFLSLGIESYKPVLTAFLLPPLPWLVLVLFGAMMLRSRRVWGWSLILISVGAMWLGSCMVGAALLHRLLLPRWPAFDRAQMQRLQADVAAHRPVAIVVLGGGRDQLAPEYGTSSLSANSLERLRYGLWLARRTGAPVAFSGGSGHAEPGAAPEAEVAARIAGDEFGQRLRWVENESRDTRENAARSIALLSTDGVSEIVLVTQAWHMPRALRAFSDAAASAGRSVRLHAAPVGMSDSAPYGLLRWLPSAEGFKLTREVLREKIGLWAGA